MTLDERKTKPVAVGRVDCTGRVVRFATVAEAEAFIADYMDALDPIGVECGDYYIDEPNPDALTPSQI